MNKINYTTAPADVEQALDVAIVTDDFLPTPDKLVRKVQKEKITIALDKDSLELFKKYANKHNSKYQTMINGVISSYADKYLRK